MTTKVNVEPLSVNKAWKGQRFKTDDYKNFAKVVLFTLPKIILPYPPFSIYLEFGMSNKASDFDNPVKPFVDLLQAKYNFNDRDIMEAHIK